MYIVLEYLLIENFIINYLILKLTKILNRVDGGNYRILFGAIISSFYSLVFFYPKLTILTKTPFKILLSILIVRFSFKYFNIRLFLRLLMSFYIGSFIFAGATLGIFFYKNNSIKLLDKAMKSFNSFPVIYLIIGVSISFVIAILVFRYSNIRKTRDGFIADIEIYYKDKKLDIKTLLDTGNSLIDPISNKKVMIVEYEKLSEILPKEIKGLIFAKDNNNYLEVEKILSELNNQIKLIPIPFKSVGKSGIIFCFKPDSIIIKYLNNVLERQDILIGIYNSTFSKDLGYSGLLHYEIVDGGIENEIYKIQT